MAITDSFTGTDGAALGSGWELAEGTLAWEINSNKARPRDNYAYSFMVRTEASFPDDQYAECLCGYFTGDSYSRTGPGVRISGSSGYYLIIADTSLGLYRRNAGTFTEITTVSITHTKDVPEVFRLTATGTGLVATQGGVERINTTYSGTGALTSGKPGMLGLRQSQYPTCDDFACTDASGAAAGQPTMTRFGGTHGARGPGRLFGRSWKEANSGILIPNYTFNT